MRGSGEELNESDDWPKLKRKFSDYNNYADHPEASDDALAGFEEESEDSRDFAQKHINEELLATLKELLNTFEKNKTVENLRSLVKAFPLQVLEKHGFKDCIHTLKTICA